MRFVFYDIVMTNKKQESRGKGLKTKNLLFISWCIWKEKLLR
jgi:hypothetical protein